MKQTILASVLALALGVSGIAFAQDASEPASNMPAATAPSSMNHQNHHHMKQKGYKFLGKLNLSKEQKVQVREIMKKQHEETMKQIREILTPEQQKTLDEQMTKMHEHHGKKRYKTK